MVGAVYFFLLPSKSRAERTKSTWSSGFITVVYCILFGVIQCNLPKIRGLGKRYSGVRSRQAYSSSIRSLTLSFV